MFSAEVNTSEFARAMRAMSRRVRAATRRAELKAAHTVERETKKTLNTTAHLPGTPTPSKRGSPPSKVTGTLGRSVQVGVLREVRPGVLAIDVGPTAVQARIQELGGTIRPKKAKALAFRVDGHLVLVKQVTLPARPYLRPTVERLTGDGSLLDIYDREWARALGGEA